MARTLDEVKGSLTALQMAKQSKEVQAWIAEIKRLSDDLIIQDMNAGGEDAVRALGVQKGLRMACMLDDILEATVKGKEAQTMAEMKNKLKL